ncbi:glycosyltransferase [Paenibacillus ehimensis]|uniref:glycosyltransferase n=1 Tax=Paenibacillus ehimensis TaxID=79264 RepID=UPI002DB830A6|nr:glycosyltransferase [Paenibacillus ehimensis]MEC0213250.1 glycosyltransferase [Paenibacillus ehimensis]
MKRLLLFTEATGAGVLSAIENTCRYLDNDFEITFLYYSREETPSHDELRKRLGSRINICQIPSRTFKLFKLFKEFKKYVEMYKPDIIHLHSSYAGFIGRIALLSSATDTKVFYSPHCFAFERNDLNLITKKMYLLIETFLTKRCGQIIAVSKHEQQLAYKIGANESYLVYNTLPHNAQKSLNASNKKVQSHKIVIATIGRLSNQKNPQLFINLAKKFSHNQDIKFIWIGGGSKKWQTKINKLVLGQDNIEFTGWKNRTEVLSLLSNVDIYLHTASWEALPISILEAMFHQKPLVIKYYPGVKELVTENYNGFIGQNEEELFLYLRKLIDDKSLRHQFGENSLTLYYENYDPPKTMSILKDIYLNRGVNS